MVWLWLTFIRSSWYNYNLFYLKLRFLQRSLSLVVKTYFSIVNYSCCIFKTNTCSIDLKSKTSLLNVFIIWYIPLQVMTLFLVIDIQILTILFMCLLVIFIRTYKLVVIGGSTGLTIRTRTVSVFLLYKKFPCPLFISIKRLGILFGGMLIFVNYLRFIKRQVLIYSLVIVFR